MAKQIFVNLPVKDLKRSMNPFSALGIKFNPKFSDDTVACMVIGENIYAMLLTVPKFMQFTDRKIADSHEFTEVLIAIDVESRKDVDRMVELAAASGGSIYSEAQDHGWMYQHAFADPDGHQWEILFMDESLLPK